MRTLNPIELETVAGGGMCGDGCGGLSIGDVLSGNAIGNGNSVNFGGNSFEVSDNFSGNSSHAEKRSTVKDYSVTKGEGGRWHMGGSR